MGWFLVVCQHSGLFGKVLAPRGVGIISAMLLASFLDMGHILVTSFRSYLDGEERENRPFLLFVVPAIVVSVNLMVCLAFGFKALYYVFGYFNFFHVLRQQYGWLRISCARSGEPGGNWADFDALVLYAGMILPFMWAHFSGEISTTKLALGANPFLSGLCKCALAALSLAYGMAVLWRIARKMPLNSTATLIVSTSLLTWGGAVFLESPLLGFTANIMHAIPYLVITFVTSRNRAAGNGAFGKGFLAKGGILAYAVVLALTAVFANKVLGFLGRFEGGQVFGIPFWVVLSFTSTLFFMHYIIDGRIWKRHSGYGSLDDRLATFLRRI